MFAGRVYNEPPLPGLLAMWSINEQGRKNRLAEHVAVIVFGEIEDTTSGGKIFKRYER